MQTKHCTTYRDSACHGTDQRLVETSLGRQHPTHPHESDTFKNGSQFVAEHCSVGGSAVLSLPARRSIASDIQMEGVSALIDPVPQLKNDPASPCIREETRTLNDWSFLNQIVIVPDAGHKNSAGSKFFPNLRGGLSEVLVA